MYIKHHCDRRYCLVGPVLLVARVLDEVGEPWHCLDALTAYDCVRHAPFQRLFVRRAARRDFLD
eukprot:8120892-Pyramimonas_sp.AAC.1